MGGGHERVNSARWIECVVEVWHEDHDLKFGCCFVLTWGGAFSVAMPLRSEGHMQESGQTVLLGSFEPVAQSSKSTFHDVVGAGERK